MKNLKKYLALTLAILMLLCSLAACEINIGTGSSKGSGIEGKWVATWDATDFINDTMAAALGDPALAEAVNVSKFKLTMVLELDDGDADFYADKSDLEDTLDDLKDDVIKGLRKYLQDQVGAQLSAAGMTLDQFLESQGMDLEAMMDENMDMSAIAESFEQSCEYKLKGSKLYLFEGEMDEDNYWKIDLDGDTLKVKEAVGEDEDANDILFPLTFKRK